MQSLEWRPSDTHLSISPQPVVALIAGILIFLVPRLLNTVSHTEENSGDLTDEFCQQKKSRNKPIHNHIYKEE